MITIPAQCEIPTTHVANEIRWLEIHDEDGGFYLYQMISKNQPPNWDSFYQNLDDVLIDCREVWGVSDDMWQPLSSPEGG